MQTLQITTKHYVVGLSDISEDSLSCAGEDIRGEDETQCKHDTEIR